MLVACDDGSSSSKPLAFSGDQVSVSTLDQSLEGYRLRAVGNGGDVLFLASSETQGAVLFDQSRQLLATAGKGDSKSLDVLTSDNSAEHWLAFVDESENLIRLKSIANNAFKGVGWQQQWSSAVAAVCLSSAPVAKASQSPSDRSLYLWAVLESGRAYQYLLHVDSRQVKPLLVRELALGEGVNQCAVDEQSQRFFWSQQGVGVLSLNSDQEQDEERRLIAGVAPVADHLQAPSDLQVLSSSRLLLSYGDYVEVLSLVDGELHESVQKINFLNHFSSVVFLPSEDSDINGEFWALEDEGNTLYRSKTAVKLSINKGATGAQTAETFEVIPHVETETVESHGDAADDPEVWVNHHNPEKSFVLSTDKQQGLWVHDLTGRAQQFLSRGRLNNVDVRYDVLNLSDDKKVDVAIATNRTTNNVDLYRIDEHSGRVELISDSLIDESLGEPYGACLYSSASTGNTSLFVNNKAGLYQQWQLNRDVLRHESDGHSGSRELTWAKKVREFRLKGQPEGCVADDAAGVLYVGEENYGLWRLSADADQPATLSLIDDLSSGNLVADVEGMSLYEKSNGDGYLVVSSQGDNAYVLYDRRSNDYLGRFRVGINLQKGIDGSSETDGLAVSSANLGGVFSDGVLVVQDGRNRMPDARQNFKLVPWSSVMDRSGLH